MSLQILHQTVCWSRGLSDTQSVSTTRLTTAGHAPATTGQFAVSVNLAPSLRAPTQSHRTAAGAAKVRRRHLLGPQHRNNVPLMSDLFIGGTFPAGCLYQGRERANGETWDDPSDPCAVCVCHEGSVRCERKPCPPSNCNHPVGTECCMSCDGEGIKRLTAGRICEGSS